MIVDEVIAPDGKSWYVSIPPERDRAVFCRPYGTAWLLYRFARGVQGAADVLASIVLEYGHVETAVVALDTAVKA